MAAAFQQVLEFFGFRVSTIKRLSIWRAVFLRPISQELGGAADKRSMRQLFLLCLQ